MCSSAVGPALESPGVRSYLGQDQAVAENSRSSACSSAAFIYLYLSLKKKKKTHKATILPASPWELTYGLFTWKKPSVLARPPHPSHSFFPPLT